MTAKRMKRFEKIGEEFIEGFPPDFHLQDPAYRLQTSSGIFILGILAA